jgi:hypothetical protein
MTPPDRADPELFDRGIDVRVPLPPAAGEYQLFLQTTCVNLELLDERGFRSGTVSLCPPPHARGCPRHGHGLAGSSAGDPLSGCPEVGISPLDRCGHEHGELLGDQTKTGQLSAAAAIFGPIGNPSEGCSR